MIDWEVKKIKPKFVKIVNFDIFVKIVELTEQTCKVFYSKPTKCNYYS